MAENKPGWYPNPDGSANQRRWDGTSWTTETRDYPPPSKANPKASEPEPQGSDSVKQESIPEQKDFFQSITKTGWLTIAGVAGLILLLIAVVPAFSNGIQAEQDRANNKVVHPLITPQPAKPVAKPTPAGPTVLPLGTPIVSPNYSLVIDSVEVLDQIETTRGGPIVADPGTKLVLVHSTITITGNAQDLTCGSDLFMHAYDSNKSEMANVFEGPRIPGNPECNYKTSAGQTVAWNFAFKMGADRTPAILSVIDTDVAGAWGEEIFASLQQGSGFTGNAWML